MLHRDILSVRATVRLRKACYFMGNCCNHWLLSINTSRGVFPPGCVRTGIWHLEFVQWELFLIISLYLLSFIQFHIVVWNKKKSSDVSFVISINKTCWGQNCFYQPEVSGPSGLSVHALGDNQSRKKDGV